MRRIAAASLALALLSGCGMRTAGTREAAFENPRNKSSIGAPPTFALPGVPLQSEAQLAARNGSRPAASAAAPEQPKAPPAAAAKGTKADFEFHLSEARRYAAKKKHLSAAAEYKAALRYTTKDDPATVHLMERQGAMMLRAGKMANAKADFLAAIARAGELNLKNDDLANSHLGLAYCQEKSRQIPDAIANYQKVMELSTSKFIKGRVEKTISELKQKK